MPNRILHVQVRDHSLDPAQAEVWVTVTAEHVSPATEVRGRLTGPRCAHAATVEVAYPLRPLVRPPDGVDGLTVRAVIPEPSLWEPECPFVYQAIVELWEGGLRCDQAQVRHGLRRVLLSPAGLRVNGGSLFLRGRRAAEGDEVRAAEWRRAGCNLLLAPADGLASALWDAADVQGLFVLGRLSELRDAALGQAKEGAAHPSCFGWLLDAKSQPMPEAAFARVRELAGGAVIGVELHEPPSDSLPKGVDFIACDADRVEVLRGLGRPLLLLGGGAEAPGVFGAVE